MSQLGWGETTGSVLAPHSIKMAAMATLSRPYSSSAEPRRPHRVLVAFLLLVATPALVVGGAALWVDRQLLNTDDWTDTSSSLIANPTIRQTVSTFVVNQVLKDTKLDHLPGSGPGSKRVTAEVKRLASNLVAHELATRQGIKAWRVANRLAHHELLRILNGDRTVVFTRGGVVVLNLGPIVEDVTRGLANTAPAAALIGDHKDTLLGVLPRAGRIVIMRSTQLADAQDGVKAIRGLAIVLPIAALVLFALAVGLARTWRRLVIRRIGWCLIAAGVCVLVVRRLLEPPLVDSLIRARYVHPAADAAWLIATTQLRTTAYVMIVAGMLTVAAAWLAGPTRPARALRRQTNREPSRGDPAPLSR